MAYVHGTGSGAEGEKAITRGPHLTKSDKLFSALSPLSRAPFDAQIDCLRNAQRGNSRCARLWTEFETMDPSNARIAAEWVYKNAVVNKHNTNYVNDQLTKAQHDAPEVAPVSFMPRPYADGTPPDIAANLAARASGPDIYGPDPVENEHNWKLREQQRAERGW